MVRANKSLLIATTAILVWALSAPAVQSGDKLTGVIVGRTGEVLHISVPQPVREGTIFSVRLLESQPPIAEARVLSCTQERPFIALAKVVRGDVEVSVPTGVRAYTGVDAVRGTNAPIPMSQRRSDDRRVSLQAGVFYPRTPILRDTIADYWQSYRLNYSILKSSRFDAMFSAEYIKGTGEFIEDGSHGSRTMEVIPLALICRLKPMVMGDTSFFIGGGGGIYLVRSEERVGTSVTSQNSEEFGFELAAGLESKDGWTLELRYRDVQDTDIQGFSLGLGARF